MSFKKLHNRHLFQFASIIYSDTHTHTHHPPSPQMNVLNKKNWFPKNSVWANYSFGSVHYIPLFHCKSQWLNHDGLELPKLPNCLVHFWLNKMDLIITISYWRVTLCMKFTMTRKVIWKSLVLASLSWNNNSASN